MPNWCENDLQVTGDETRVREFLEFAGTTETPIDFNRFIPYPPRFAERDRAAEAWRDAHDTREWSSAPKDGFNSGGYEWCIEHWGTKWNAHRAVAGEMTVRRTTATAVVHFDTAWSPPLPVVLSASRRFPALVFDLRWYERGMRVRGRYRCRDGAVLCDRSWDYSGPRGG